MLRANGFFKFMQLSQRFSPVSIFRFIIHLPNFFKLFSRLLHDSRVPFHLKLLCYASIVYFFLPIDLLRDFPFFFVGHIDDVMFLFLAFRKLVKDSPPEVVQEHVKAISEGL
ncbi:MAG: DUF1232 domain-containing protein [Candidatus Omnitrophota bacterium]|jgi:uncharacterized membrane protein YkvA (DUF1232 family)|nr:MAG: DUF1232 domain-containing protein [Candidatus Omnitrophota bacterium]